MTECPSCRVRLEPIEVVFLPEGPKPTVRLRRLQCPRCRQQFDADPWWWERGPGREAGGQARAR